MKNIAYAFLLISLSGCFDKAPVFKTGLEGKPLPSFKLLLPDGNKYFNTSNIPPGMPMVFFDFSPWCPYCKAQTEDIITNMKSLKHIRFYFLTTAPLSNLKEFYTHYHLQDYPNITIGQDSTNSFGNYFKAQGVPYLAIYTSQKQLRQVLIGKSEIGDIKSIALE